MNSEPKSLQNGITGETTRRFRSRVLCWVEELVLFQTLTFVTFKIFKTLKGSGKKKQKTKEA